jgi:hypothetical protein
LPLLDLRHGLVVLGPFGPVIELGIAERDVEGAMPHELFDDFEQGAGIEELGGKRMPLMPSSALAAESGVPNHAESL